MSNMRQGRYTPTTEEVCDGFHGDPRKFEQAGEPIDAIGSNYGSKCYAAFHRWLKEHDARIRREALTLSDEEIGEMAVRIYTDPDDHEYLEIPKVHAQQQYRAEHSGYYQKLTEAIKSALAHIAASRERES